MKLPVAIHRVKLVPPDPPEQELRAGDQGQPEVARVRCEPGPAAFAMPGAGRDGEKEARRVCRWQTVGYARGWRGQSGGDRSPK